MFTGIVEGAAVVGAIDRGAGQARMRFGVAFERLELGESIAINGVCLTVSEIHQDGFSADVSSESLAVTTLGALAVGARANAERASRLGGRMGGHLVLGHVDAVGSVKRFEPDGNGRRLTVTAPRELAPYWAAKGSIAVDGVSLTINRVIDDCAVEIMLVPHTLANTRLSGLRVGDRVNLEVDVLARYVARQLQRAGVLPSQGGDSRLMEALQRGGFVA